VTVANGIATVTGHALHRAEKDAAERAALRIPGVRAVVDRIELRCPEGVRASDEALAERVADIVAQAPCIPPGSLAVVGENGCVKMRGAVPCEHQKAAIEPAVAGLDGVLGFKYLIWVRPSAPEEGKAAALAVLRQESGISDARLGRSRQAPPVDYSVTNGKRPSQRQGPR
jgi:hypothetical protein